jgi:hypothetical protein
MILRYEYSKGRKVDNMPKKDDTKAKQKQKISNTSKRSLKETALTGKQSKSEWKESKQGEGKQAESKHLVGKHVESMHTEGKHPDGKDVDGKRAEGKRAEGKRAEGKRADGKPTEGKRAEGKPTEGKRAEGKPTEGKHGDGNHAEGNQVEHGQSVNNKSIAEAATSRKAREEIGDSGGQANRGNKVYAQLQQACARSANMQGKLRQKQMGLTLELPDALPSTLLLRALQKNSEQYGTLSTERITPHAAQPTQLQLDVAGLKETQLQTFIEELDELIGQFTGRS